MPKLEYPTRYLMGLAPYHQEIGYVTKKGYFMEAAHWEGDFKQGAKFTPAILEIRQDNRGIEIENDMGGANWFALDPAEIVKGLCGEDGMKRASAGILAIAGPEPTDDEIICCLGLYEKEGRRMVEEADASFSTHHKITEISSAAKRWAHYFGLKREWASEVERREVKACVNCGETVLAVAKVCKECGHSADVLFDPSAAQAAPVVHRRRRRNAAAEA